MTISGTYIRRKINKDLSSPELISLFLVVCLIVIFSLESVGLIGVKKSVSSIPMAVPVKIETKDSNNSQILLDKSNLSFSKTSTKLSKMKELEDLRVSSLLLEAAENQTKYERTLKKNKANQKQIKEPIVDYAEDGEIFFFYV